MTTDSAGNDAPASPPPRWPRVVGTIGAVLGAIMFVDKADDLALIPLLWAGESRSLLLGPESLAHDADPGARDNASVALTARAPMPIFPLTRS